MWMLSCSARYFPAAPSSHRIPRRTRRIAPVRSTPKDNMSIQEYIEEHGLGKKVEDVINAAVKAKAAEPVSFMVRRGESNHRFGKRRLKDPGWIGARRRGMDPALRGSIFARSPRGNLAFGGAFVARSLGASPASPALAASSGRGSWLGSSLVLFFPPRAEERSRP